MKASKTENTRASNCHSSSEPFFNKGSDGAFFSKSGEAGTPLFTPSTIQPKLTIGQPGDRYEQEADSMAQKVVQNLGDSKSSPLIQPKCDGCEQEESLQKMEEEEIKLSRKPLFGSEQIQGMGIEEADPHIETQLQHSKGGGHPLDPKTRFNMEQSFGADFGGVRVHTGNDAVQMNQKLGAKAFTHSSDLYFNSGNYNPDTKDGNQLLAHELTHVLQQQAAPAIHRQAGKQSSTYPLWNSNPGMAGRGPLLQLYPGDGMVRPGDCSWFKYLGLRGSVETAKAVVSTLGRCTVGDSCLFLAAKIAAIASEIAARQAVMVTCFKGGDTTHREEVQNKVNMMNRCYRYFTASNCSQELIGAMAVVVERAREAIAAVAIAAMVAALITLIVAIIALAKIIAAAIAAAAAAASEAAAITAAAAAIISLLVLVRDQISSDENPPPA